MAALRPPLHRTADWAATGTSALGGSHRLSGQPNQDAFLVAEVAGAVTLVVADGHGSAASFRSDRGSRLATEAGRWLAGAVVGAGAGTGDDPAEVRAALPALVAEMVGRWQAAVRADVARDPITPEEDLDPTSATELDVLLAYGSTFLLAVLTPAYAAFVQIGDGDLVVRRASGATAAAVAGDDRLVANETTSLSHVVVERDVRCAVVDLAADPIDLVLSSSDGYGNAFEEEAWAVEVAEDLVELAASEGLGWVAEHLPGWADDAALVAGDDVTIVVAFAQSGKAAGGDGGGARG